VFASDFIEQILPAIMARHPAVSATIDDNDDNHIYIASFAAQTRSLATPGHACLRDLLEQADLHDVVVELQVEEDLASRHGMKLIAFYQNFGFVDDENGWCMRLPQPVAPSVADPLPCTSAQIAASHRLRR
jgi:hypothetical protein